MLQHTKWGFRSELSAQDTSLIIKEDVIRNMNKGSEHLILALDLKAAFDDFFHSAILEVLNELHCGERTYNHIKAFLSTRTASVGIGDIRSDPFIIPNQETPQVSIISLYSLTSVDQNCAIRGASPLIGFNLYPDGHRNRSHPKSISERIGASRSHKIGRNPSFRKWATLRPGKIRTHLSGVHNIDTKGPGQQTEPAGGMSF